MLISAIHTGKRPVMMMVRSGLITFWICGLFDGVHAVGEGGGYDREVICAKYNSAHLLT